MPKAIISPFSKKMRNGAQKSSKDYPWWPELVRLLRDNGYTVTQIGIDGEDPIGADEFIKGLSFEKLKELALKADIAISVDNFFQHLCDNVGKKCYVLFGQSDPRIFGHTTNINILKDRKYLRSKQFDIWEVADILEDCFVAPDKVMSIIKSGGINGIEEGL